MLLCCSLACKKKILQAYAPTEFPGSERFTAYLKERAKAWGEITSAVVDAVELCTLDREGFHSARTFAARCVNGHDTHAVVLSKRLYFFMFRVGLLLASNWDFEESGNLRRRGKGNDWPTPETLTELADIVTDYFGAADLEEVQFDRFHKILDASDKAARAVLFQVIEAAELFVLFHELFHVIPSSLRPQLRFGDLTQSFWQSSRGKAWTNEMEIDGTATATLLVAAAARSYATIRAQKPWAAFVVFAGADLALHSIEFLERISYGAISITDGSSHAACDSHPPARFRRNIWSHTSKDLALNFAQLDEVAWSNVRISVGALMNTRQELFDTFFVRRADIVAEVRAV